jgi:ABC-type glutathione transport system ATPase component
LAWSAIRLRQIDAAEGDRRLAPVASGASQSTANSLARRDKAFYREVQMVFQDPYGSLHPRWTVDACCRNRSPFGFADGERRIQRAVGRKRLPLPLFASIVGRPAPA